MMNLMIDTNHIIIIYIRKKIKLDRLDTIYGQTINLLPICNEFVLLLLLLDGESERYLPLFYMEFVEIFIVYAFCRITLKCIYKYAVCMVYNSNATCILHMQPYNKSICWIRYVCIIHYGIK